jgi:hypothetical protein
MHSGKSPSKFAWGFFFDNLELMSLLRSLKLEVDCFFNKCRSDAALYQLRLYFSLKLKHEIAMVNAVAIDV